MNDPMAEIEKLRDQLQVAKSFINDCPCFCAKDTLCLKHEALAQLGGEKQPGSERCTICGNQTVDWVDPDWSNGRICRKCESERGKAGEKQPIQFESFITRKLDKDGTLHITCKRGLWGVHGPNHELVEQEAQRYFFQYIDEYNTRQQAKT